MTLHYIHPNAPDYAWCSYGDSRLQFRGPPCDFDRPYLAYLGGAETFGRFMDDPYPSVIARRTGLGCLNLAAVNGGVDFCLHAPETFGWINGAQAVMIEVMGAAHLSNAFFKVHPRRNDRVVSTHHLLTDVFYGTDFVDIHFIRHLMAVLQNADSDQYLAVCQVLKSTWVARMSSLLSKITVPVHLVWMADHDPSGVGLDASAPDPFLVDQDMLDAVGSQVDSVIVSCGKKRYRPDPSLRFSEFDYPAAAQMLGKPVHLDVADQIVALCDVKMQKARHGRRAL